jgi:hypothetical protein
MKLYRVVIGALFYKIKGEKHYIIRKAIVTARIECKSNPLYRLH